MIGGGGMVVTKAKAALLAVAVLAATALVGCAPPPLDLTGTEGPYGVSVTRDLRIPLPDGRVLRADLYEPTDLATGRPEDGPFPVIIGFTPYGKSFATSADAPGASGVNLDLVRHGYLAAAVDVPGTGASDGAFDLFDHAEAVAGAAVVDWAASLPRSSGSVGMLGVSYMGIVQLFTAAEVGPGSPLKAVFPMAATIDPYRDLFVSGGALNVMSPLGLLFGYGITRSITPFTELWNDPAAAVQHAGQNLGQMSRFEGVMAADMLANGPRRYDGDWWQQRAPERLLQRIAENGVAVYLVGGLYDVFQRGEPLIYSGLQNAAAGRPVDAPMEAGQPVTDRFQLLTGPWTHGNLGDGLDLTAIQLAWFDRWLKGSPSEADGSSEAPLHIIEPGGSSYDADTYPLADATVERLWLREGRELADAPPVAGEPGDEIAYDPFGEVCSVSTVQFAAGMFAEDCLRPTHQPDRSSSETTYSTAPLDSPAQLAGPIGLTLYATSDRPDAVFAVSVEDVAPDGTSMQLTGGAQLASMRALDPSRSWTAPGGGYLRPYLRLTADAVEPVPTGVPVRYDIEVRPAFATVPAGHRIRLRIATHDFPHLIPLADLPGLFGGTYRLLHEPGAASFVNLSLRSVPTPAASTGA